MSSKKPEDLTLDEIKEQMALYQRLYYYRTRDNPDMKESRKESKRRYYQKKNAEKEEQKKLEETNSDEPPPERNYNRKYKKDITEAMMVIV